MKGKHFIGLNEFSRDDLDLILARADALKAGLKRGKNRESLAGQSIAMIFEKNSTRTRVSFEVGIRQLGGQPLFLSGSELQISRGEPIRDTARVLSRYVNGIVIRAKHHKDVVEFTQYSSVPVINALTDLLHPCQILADLQTVREKGKDLDRAVIAFIGDGNNIANSWINAAIHYRFELRIACPPKYDPDRTVLKAARDRGANVKIVRRPLEAARGADVLYTDVWVSMGQEKEVAKRKLAFKDFQINQKLMKAAAPDHVILHCLPAHRGEEITDEAIESANSAVFDEAENRLHTQKAVLELVCGR